MFLRVGMRDADKYDVVDIDTGEKLQLVLWANDETGEYAVLRIEECEGRRHVAVTSEGYPITDLKKGNIKLVRQNETDAER